MGIGLLTMGTALLGADASPDRIRDAAGKAVAAIQASQKVWAKQTCASCHHDFLPVPALKAAREHGIPLDEAAFGQATVHAFSSLANLDRAVQYTHEIDPAMDDANRLLAASAAGVNPSVVTAVYARFIALHQKPDGHWDTGDARPPQSYSSFTATATALRAVQLYSHPSLAQDTRARIEKSRRWLESARPRSTEDRVQKLFGLAWAGAEASVRNKFAADLLATQQPDGGWNSLDDRPSDAYSTGQALVALSEAAGIATSDPRLQRGIEYLLRTQAVDGTWHVQSRLHPPAPVSPPYFESGHPYGHDQFISMMGESWAVRALAAALGPGQPKDLPPLHEAAPTGVEPWAETMLFGTAEQVRLLLDKKLDPNVATKAGGTTALMMAVPDPEKTALLLDRGAKINARSKTRYSALLVASHYPNGAPVMRTLLGRGAEMALPKGAGLPLFGAYPTAWAALAGNVEILKALKAAGDKNDAPVTLLGLAPVTPLTMAATFNDISMIRALVEGGATVDFPDDDGITPLGWAALTNHPEAARVLIEKGADVNHVDKRGMTALLYAASIDYGDAELIAVMRKAGAKMDAKSPEGLTAPELARKYQHRHFF
jgi:ankyrin repeat protein